MAVQHVDAPGAQALVQDEGYTYLDVRTVEEFAAGHPEGAYNVPILNRDEMGRMVPNEDFLAVVQANFAAETKLVVGCKAGGRSARAAGVLEANGYANLADNTPGWGGSRDGTPGWSACDLPTGDGAPEGRSYESLAAKVAG